MLIGSQQWWAGVNLAALAIDELQQGTEGSLGMYM